MKRHFAGGGENWTLELHSESIPGGETVVNVATGVNAWAIFFVSFQSPRCLHVLLKLRFCYKMAV